MKTLEKNLDDDKNKKLFFDAWKYEYSNPAMGLIGELVTKYGNPDARKNVLRAAIHLFSSGILDINSEEIRKIATGEQGSLTKNFSDQLETILQTKIKDQKLIIIIDDLDRCDVENSLQILAIMKLFFDIPNCICIAAVDFNILENAWLRKYSVQEKVHKKDGREYLDKIFQVRIGIPEPTEEQIKDYLKSLIENISDELLELLTKLSPKNPRSIKRMLNLIFYRKLLLNSDECQIFSILWTLLEECVSNSGAVALHEFIEKKGNTIIALSKSHGDNWQQLQPFVNSSGPKEIFKEESPERVRPFFRELKNFLDKYSIDETQVISDLSYLCSNTKETLRLS
ncbi:MAG: KAP family NTPase [Nitrosopumilus sp.]|nr:KAP family NTPase [Nitrosopumilus sp.]